MAKRNLRYRRGPSKGTPVGVETDTFVKPFQERQKTWNNARTLYEVSSDPAGVQPIGHAFLTEAMHDMVAKGFLAPGTKITKKRKKVRKDKNPHWYVSEYYFVVYRNPHLWWLWRDAGFPGSHGPVGELRTRPDPDDVRSIAFAKGYLYYADIKNEDTITP